MTQQYGGPTSPQEQRATPDVARDEAADVARTAADKSGEIAGTVGEQAGRVASETRQQARNLLHEGREQLTGQARQGQQRAAEGLHTIATQLEQMSEKTEGQGVAQEVARQAAERTHGVASWLEHREPGDLIDEVRKFARRKPGVFLLGAVLAGAAVGRLTRGAIAAQSDDSGGDGDATGAAGAQIPRQASAPVPPRHAAEPTYPQPGRQQPLGYAPVPPAPPVWNQQTGPVNP
jgi:hypothetical protein